MSVLMVECHTQLEFAHVAVRNLANNLYVNAVQNNAAKCQCEFTKDILRLCGLLHT